MGSITIGNAPDSWGVWFPNDPRQVAWSVFLDEVKDAGYSCIELGPWGFLPTDTARLADELASRELTLVASTVGCNFLEEESVSELLDILPQVAALQGQLAAPYVVLLPAMYTDLFDGREVMPPRLSTDERNLLNANIERVGRFVHDELGLTATVHPHVDSHLETEEDIEFLLKHTDPDAVSLCLDIGHHAYGGGNAISFLRRHSDRIPYIHLKNCDGEVLAKMRANGWSFAEAVTHNIMCEPWNGMVDFKALKMALDEIGYSGFAVVEQDMYPAPPGRPLPIARKTREYLKQVGIG